MCRRAAGVLAALLVFPAVAMATSLGITPTMLSIAPSGVSGTLLLQNRGPQPTRIQITALSWTHDPAGEMVLAPTEELVAYPALATIPAGASLRIRVGPLRRATRATEASFRLLIEELPPAVADRRPGITVRTRLSIPVFLAPARAAAQVRVMTPRLSAGAVGVALVNLGSVHVRYDRIRVQVRDRTGATRMDETRPGWYLLAGESRVIELALPPDVCAQVGAVHVEVPIGRTVLSELATPATCDG